MTLSSHIRSSCSLVLRISQPRCTVPSLSSALTVLSHRTHNQVIPSSQRYYSGDKDESKKPRSSKTKKTIKEVFENALAIDSESVVVPQIQLRDYQEDCIQSVLAAISTGKKRLGVSLATGGGKTVVFTQLISRVPPLSSRATRTLILAHRRELIEQAITHCRRAYPDLHVEIEMGSQHASGLADITVASIQSINSRDRHLKFNPLDYKLILVDEAHHIVAKTYLGILGHLNLRKMPPPDTEGSTTPVLVGVSATFSRNDGIALGAAIDEIVYHRDYITMISERWLSDVSFSSISSNVDLSNVRSSSTTGDFIPSDLSLAVNTQSANEIVARTWLSMAADRKSTLVFCVDISHVKAMTEEFVKRGVVARFVTGDTPGQLRADTLDEFRAGKFPVLINCGVFTEGTDIPNIDCVILNRPTKSKNLLIQMIGRGMRLSPGKKDCHIIDMVAALGRGILTSAHLFGLDPDELLDKTMTLDELLEAQKKKERTEDEKELQNKLKETLDAAETESNSVLSRMTDEDIDVSVIQYSSVFDLVADVRPDEHIRSISFNAWVAVDRDRYILSGPDNSHLRVCRAEDGRNAFQLEWLKAIPVVKKGDAPFMRPRVLATGKFHDLVAAGDTYANQHMPHAFIDKNARWRRGPPTEGQLVFLNKLRGTPLTSKFNYKHMFQQYRTAVAEDPWLPGKIKTVPTEGPVTLFNCTKGMAGDMLTKYTHGAKGRFIEEKKEQRKAERLVLKKLKMEEREVKVGPVGAIAKKLEDEKVRAMVAEVMREQRIKAKTA